jgi:hypothetical protein
MIFRMLDDFSRSALRGTVALRLGSESPQWPLPLPVSGDPTEGEGPARSGTV